MPTSDFIMKIDSLASEGEDVFINRVAAEDTNTVIHTHEFVEIAYVSSGKGIHKIRNFEHFVSKGDILIINFNTPHTFHCLEDSSSSTLTIYNCIFLPQFLDCTYNNCNDFYKMNQHFYLKSIFPMKNDKLKEFILLKCHDRETEEIFEKLYLEYKMKTEGYLEIMRVYILELLIRIFRSYRAEGSLQGKNNSTHKEIIEKTIQFIKLNYTSELKLDEVALSLFISPNYLCKLFKDFTGMTFREYVQKVRMNEACRLLMETNKTILEIAGDIGYHDLKHFYWLFKRSMSITPKEYRKMFASH